MRSALFLSLLATASALPTWQSESAKLVRRSFEIETVDGQYLVTLKTDYPGNVESFLDARDYVQTPDARRTFQIDSFKGFAMDPAVLRVEQNIIFPIASVIEQYDAPWGLARLSKASNESDSNNPVYRYDESAGEGTCAYVVDTGIFTDNADFEGRATFGVNYVEEEPWADLEGHGTHVAGTIGSKTYGVAKKAQLIAVKVCNQFGGCDAGDVVKGLEWVGNDSRNRSCPRGVVLNLSLGSTSTSWEAVRDAVSALATRGYFIAVAAGNFNINAKDTYPASATDACTVGATDRNNSRSSFSNFGSVVDVFAPGRDIQSLSNVTGDPKILSGTSMASPHIAGLGAYYLALEGIIDPIALCQKIKDRSLKNVLFGIPNGTTNALANNGL